MEAEKPANDISVKRMEKDMVLSFCDLAQPKNVDARDKSLGWKVTLHSEPLKTCFQNV